MGIAKFDDSIPQGPKFLKAGPICCWLWFASVCYSHRTLTDGYLPKEIVPALVIGLKQPFVHAARLVEVGLWDDAIGGYQVHDYLHWNPSKSQVEGYRANDKDRKQKERAERPRPDGRPNGQSERTSDPPHSTTRARTHAGAKSLSESSSSSALEAFGEESAREGDEDIPISTVPPKWAHGRPARSGLASGHPTCLPIAADACQRGWCIPAFLIEREWLPQVNHQQAEITQFITDTLTKHVGRTGIGENLKFWRAEWDAYHGGSVARPVTGVGRSIESARIAHAQLKKQGLL